VQAPFPGIRESAAQPHASQWFDGWPAAVTAHWLEVSIAVNGELAEAVAEVLARYAPNGVMTEQGIRHLDDEDLGTPDGPVVVRAYLPADAGLEDTRRKIDNALHYLGLIQPLPTPLYRDIPEQNWMEAWKIHYRPIPVGQRLLVVPAWMEATDPSRIAIKIDPGMAFGTGTHPSTQLCLEMIEIAFDTLEVDGRAKERFIDIGCGSGILSIAALKLGAVQALGVDTDPGSMVNARGNASANGVGSELILEVGSVREILDGVYPFRRASLVAANILAPVLIQLFQDGLAQLVEAGGSIILGGVLEGQAGEVTDAAGSVGLILSESIRRGDWVSLLMRCP
jgi:ribosomal protein L11 methyltransferase